jgi:protoporphyrinogen oxidase
MRIGVIGGGTLGLTLALRLSQRGAAVTVLETGEQPGGLSTWFDYGPFTWDKYYHVILPNDRNLRTLLEELGLASELRWVQTKTGFLWRGRLVSMSNYYEFLTFPALNLLQKVRLAIGLLAVQRLRDPARLDGRTAPDWLTSVFGRTVYARIWEPLLTSKFGVLTDRVPAVIMWATIRRYAATREAGGGQERLGYLAGGGLKVLFDGLVSQIERQGGEVQCGCPVQSINNGSPDAVEVEAGGRTWQFDRLISTVPTAVINKVAPQLAELRPRSHARPEFLGVIRLALVLREALSPYYITNLIEPGLPFTGIIEVSSLVDRQEFAGHAFVMLPRYDVPQSEWFSKSDEEVFEAIVGSLEPYWPDLRQGIVHWFVHREPIVQALWTTAPPPAAPQCTQDGRVWSINAELAGRDTLNNNAIVKVAEDAAEVWWAKQQAEHRP